AGFASSLTGTGGAMVLTPMLVWRGVPLLTAILLGQVVQLPIAATATLGHALGGGVDWAAGAALGLMLVPGVFAGRRLAQAMPLAMTTRLVGVVLLAASGGLAFKAL
ncbi:MAG: sulfite exporter TauE/SafE family protein, partial [Burkholderiales bacterium]